MQNEKYLFLKFLLFCDIPECKKMCCVKSNLMELFKETYTAQKMEFSIKDFFSNLVTFTEEILNGKLHFV